ncbi:MAG: alpha/beta fold hydrolase [Synechococcaceae cyanobacterium]
MTPSSRLRRPSPLDRAIASALLLITPEYRSVRQQQRRNGRSGTPTLAAPPAMPFERITVLGETIRIARQPRPGIPTVLLLCPLPQSILAFAPIWPALAERFNLVAVDLPGFGRSSGGLEWMSFAAQGRFLAACIEQLGLQQPHIVAPDVGMAAAVACVGANPGIAASLVIGDGPAIAPSSNGSLINKMANSGFWRFMVTLADAGTFVEAANRSAAGSATIPPVWPAPIRRWHGWTCPCSSSGAVMTPCWMWRTPAGSSSACPAPSCRSSTMPGTTATRMPPRPSAPW